MLFVIFMIILVVGVIWSVYDDNWFSITTMAIGIATVFISLIIIASSYIGIDGWCDEMHARHEILTYQLKNDVYENDNDIGKRELMEDIQSWNEDLARLGENQDDFWIGIYIPNVFDQFEPVELD